LDENLSGFDYLQKVKQKVVLLDIKNQHWLRTVFNMRPFIET